jgi:hypothetical protein
VSAAFNMQEAAFFLAKTLFPATDTHNYNVAEFLYHY